MSKITRARIVWHRRDLRLTDNTLYQVDHNTSVIPLYVFDPKEYSPRPSCSDATHNVAKVGPFATQFLLESVDALRVSIQDLGLDLYLRSGEPRRVLPSFLEELVAAGLHGDVEVVWHDEAGTDEIAEASAVRAALLSFGRSVRGKINIACSSSWGATLWHPLDLGFYRPSDRRLTDQEVDISCQAWEQIKQQGVQSFRRKAKKSPIRYPMPAPIALLPRPDFMELVSPGAIPTIADLLKPTELFGLSVEQVTQVIQSAQSFDLRSAHPFHGGERAGLAHLHSFVQGPAEFCNREGGGDAGGCVDSSAKMSAYLAFGCLSARTIDAVCKERRDGKAAWLSENLEMRDFRIFYSLAQGKCLFQRDGDNPANLSPDHWKPHDPLLWRRWVLGGTGFPLLDAAMKELLSTGYTSNRCRQIPVSVLANDLKLDWRSGAELYQWLLIDHDVGPNWGNWRYFAGTGCDPKRRHYKVISQGLRYDSDASFIQTWLPELQELPAREAHLIPIRKARSLQSDKVCWPDAVVDPMSQLSWEDQNSLGKPSSYNDSRSYQDVRPSEGSKGKGKSKGEINKAQSLVPAKSICRTEVESTTSRVRRWHVRATA